MAESLSPQHPQPDQFALFVGGGLVSHELVGADETTRARLAAHELNTDLYKLTGVLTPEQKATAEQGRQSTGYQEVQAALAESTRATAPDERTANAILVARASRAARAAQSAQIPLAKPDRTQLK